MKNELLESAQIITLNQYGAASWTITAKLDVLFLDTMSESFSLKKTEENPCHECTLQGLTILCLKTVRMEEI